MSISEDNKKINASFSRVIGESEARHSGEIDTKTYLSKVHIWVVKQSIDNLKSIRNKKVELPILVLEDLLARMEATQ